MSLCPILFPTMCPLSLSVPHTVPSVCSVSLRPLLSSTICQLSVSTSHFTVCWFCVTVSTFVFYSLSTACPYLAIYSPLFLCHCIRCCLLNSVHFVSVPHTLPSVGSVSLIHCCLLQSVPCLSVPHNLRSVDSASPYPLLSSTVCLLCQ